MMFLFVKFNTHSETTKMKGHSEIEYLAKFLMWSNKMMSTMKMIWHQKCYFGADHNETNLMTVFVTVTCPQNSPHGDLSINGIIASTVVELDIIWHSNIVPRKCPIFRFVFILISKIIDWIAVSSFSGAPINLDILLVNLKDFFPWYLIKRHIIHKHADSTSIHSNVIDF